MKSKKSSAQRPRPDQAGGEQFVPAQIGTYSLLQLVNLVSYPAPACHASQFKVLPHQDGGQTDETRKTRRRHDDLAHFLQYQEPMVVNRHSPDGGAIQNLMVFHDNFSILMRNIMEMDTNITIT